jgi:hypothetical protein
MLADLKPRARRLDRIVLRSGGRLSFLKADEVDWIEGEGNYLRVHAGKKSYLLRETLGDIEARLDPARFVRIHKSTIVNTERIREIGALQRRAFRFAPRRDAADMEPRLPKGSSRATGEKSLVLVLGPWSGLRLRTKDQGPVTSFFRSFVTKRPTGRANVSLDR